MTFLRIVTRSSFLFEHDPFGKPVPTFPDHALGYTRKPFCRLEPRFDTGSKRDFKLLNCRLFQAGTDRRCA
jgi:hypothetical protein